MNKAQLFSYIKNIHQLKKFKKACDEKEVKELKNFCDGFLKKSSEISGWISYIRQYGNHNKRKNSSVTTEEYEKSYKSTILLIANNFKKRQLAEGVLKQYPKAYELFKRLESEVDNELNLRSRKIKDKNKLDK